MIDNLPCDCRDKALSYLSLHSILSYASSNSSSLRHAIIEIKKRRQRMKEVIVWDGKDIIQTTHVCRNGRVSQTSKNKHSNEIVELPSIYNRLQSLYKMMPLSHSSRDTLFQFIFNLKENDESLSCIDDSVKSFQSLFKAFQQVILVYKLHTHILKSSIYGVWCDEHQNGCKINKSGDSIDFLLDQYLGDVYITIILMGNISSGLMEGVSERKWIESIQSYVRGDSEYAYSMTHKAKIWYQMWVFLHSTLLRTTKLSEMERMQFSISMDGNITKEKSNHDLRHDELNLICPPTLFHGLHKTSTVLQIHRKLSHCNVLLTALFRNFGPLGPSFRGRDSVRSHSIQMKDIIECYLARDCTVFVDGSDDERRLMNNIEIVRSNLSDEHYHADIIKLAMLHKESRQVRPMTCAPHTMCIEETIVL